MDKKILMIANWKMNPTSSAIAKNLFLSSIKNITKLTHVETIFCPPSIFIGFLNNKKSNIYIGAQNVANEPNGSFTGEISALQLKNCGIKYCIVGHSERRLVGEINKDCSKKIQSLLKNSITPILCIGESLRDESGNYFQTISKQLLESLEGVNKKDISKIVIAYEPLWSIGESSKGVASSKEIEEVIIHIKKVITQEYDFVTIPKLKIVYGGSVTKPSDIREILSKTSVSGFLIGRASLNSQNFTKLLQEANSVEISKKNNI